MIKYIHGKLDGFAGKNIAHCVASDGAMGAGFAAQVSRRHKEIFQSKRMYNRLIGDFIITEDAGERFSHIITKTYSNSKPSFNDFRTALSNFLDYLERKEKKSVWHCPMIGSGLDGLSWSRIAPILEQSSILFNVYVLDKKMFDDLVREKIEYEKAAQLEQEDVDQ